MTAGTKGKRLIMTLLALAGYILLLPLLRALRERIAGREFRILNYHSVGEGRRHPTNVAPAVFRRQMALLAATGRVLPLREALKPGGRSRGERTVVLTLDDGYADNLHVAAPILQEFGMTATCFVTVGHVGTMERLPHDARENAEAARILSWDEVRQWRDMGMSVGSHGMRHGRACELTEEALARELRESRRALQEALGETVDALAFPFGRSGDYDDRAVEAARAAGYGTILSAKYGWNRAGTSGKVLNRIGVDSSDTLFTLRAKLNGALDLLLLLEPAGIRLALRGLRRVGQGGAR